MCDVIKTVLARPTIKKNGKSKSVRIRLEDSVPSKKYDMCFNRHWPSRQVKIIENQMPVVHDRKHKYVNTNVNCISVGIGWNIYYAMLKISFQYCIPGSISIFMAM